jgi:transposase
METAAAATEAQGGQTMSTELYCGVDLHSNNGVYHVMGALGKQVWHRRLPNDPERVLLALRPFHGKLVSVVIESTYNWYWLADCLEDHGFNVKLANPSGIKQYSGLKLANDDTDARFIAELSRLGILPTGWICPRQLRALRDLLRRRSLMVKGRTSLINSIGSLLARETGTHSRYSMLDTLTVEELAAVVKHESQVVVVQSQLRLIAAHDAEIATLETYALQQCRPCPEYGLLTSVPGIGKILGMTMMLEIGDIGRFPRPGKLSSYARAVKAECRSNGKGKGRNNARNGNRYLGWAFIEAVQHLRRCCDPARSWYLKKVQKVDPVVGRKALASKLSKAVWYMLTRKEPFQIKRIFG